MKKEDTTVVICCAGLGSRLGIDTTKALIKIDGKTVIEYQLELLKEFDDIRIVVGYQASKVIEVVKKIRRDITFVFNHEYSVTGPGASLTKGVVKARKNILLLDGDILIKPDDFKRFIMFDNECIGVTEIKIDYVIPVEIINHKVVKFNSGEKYKWGGIAKIRTSKLSPGTKTVYEILERILPIKSIYMDILGIDTKNDYEKAKTWIKNKYKFSTKEGKSDI